MPQGGPVDPQGFETDPKNTICLICWARVPKVKTVLPCSREHDDQGFGGSDSHIFRHIVPALFRGHLFGLPVQVFVCHVLRMCSSTGVQEMRCSFLFLINSFLWPKRGNKVSRMEPSAPKMTPSGSKCFQHGVQWFLKWSQNRFSKVPNDRMMACIRKVQMGVVR